MSNKIWNRRAPARIALVLSLLAAPALTPRYAAADGLADEADLQFQLGAERYRAGDFQGALEHFLASNRLVPNRNVMFNVARSYEQLGRFADAHRYYIDALDGETNPRVLSDIRAALGRLAPNVAVLNVETTPPGATIYIDRRDLGSRGRSPRPLALPAGRYRVLAELEGYEPAPSEMIDARVGNEARVQLALRRIVGTVRVEGEAGAAVHVDDERAPSQCLSPCEIQLSPGTHMLYFTREGYQVLPRQVGVTAREITRVRAALSPLTGSIVVGTDERDARVEIDGRPVGFTPVVVPNVPVGRRTLRVTLRGFQPIERNVSVRANEQTELSDLRLIPVREVTAASRQTESIEDAPSSVTIISPQELQAFAYPTIAESLRGVRGVYVSNDHAYQSVGIRGLGQPNDYGNRLLVLSDGQPLNDNLLYSSYIGYDGRTDLHDVERIEVVRGAGSLLYGTGAISGVVNLVMRGRDEPTSVHGAISTYDNGIARGRAGFNLNLGNDRGIWASVAGARSDGQTLPMEVPGTGTVLARNVDAFWSGTTTGRAWWGALTAQWLYTQRDQVIPTGVYGTQIDDPRTRWVDTRGMFELRFDPKLSDRIQLFSRLHANNYFFGGRYSFGATADDQTTEDYRGVWFGAEARLVFRPFDSLRITAGGEAQLHPIATLRGWAGRTDPRCTDADPSACYLYYPDPNLNQQRGFGFGAGYGVVDWSPTSWFRLSGGARVDVYTTFGATVNPRLALIFKPRPGSVLKIMGGRAFRAPSVYERFYNDGGTTQIASMATPPGSTLVPPALSPETIYSGEVEYSQRFAEDWVALGAIHGGYVNDSIATFGEGDDVSPLQYRNNPSPLLTTGADVELRREFRQGWMLAVNYSFQFTRYLSDQYTQPGYEPGANGNRQVVNAPQHLAGFRAVVPIVTNVANGALRVTAEGPRRISLFADDQTPASLVADAVISGHVQRFGVRYAIGLYNLFDYRYTTPVTKSFVSPVAQQNGRTFMFNLALNF